MAYMVQTVQLSIALSCLLMLSITIADAAPDLQDFDKLLQGIANPVATQRPVKTKAECRSDEENDEVFLLQTNAEDSLPFPVCCRQRFSSEGWILIQHRFSGKLSFNRFWEEYRDGFGDLRGEFWLGLQKIHRITKQGSYELLVVMKDFNGTEKTARFDRFAVLSEREQYRLELGVYSGGDAGDSFTECHRMKFSTPDRDNDVDEVRHCAELYRSGWWFSNCYFANLNGVYDKESDMKAISWFDFNNSYQCLKETQMMIREVK